MADTARWRDARTPAPDMDNARSTLTDSGSAGATMDGTARTAAFISSRIVATAGITIKVRVVDYYIFIKPILFLSDLSQISLHWISLQNGYIADGLVDCADPECCSSTMCRSSQLCVSAPKPIDILLRKQPPAITASFFERMKFLIDDGSLQNYARQETFNER